MNDQLELSGIELRDIGLRKVTQNNETWLEQCASVVPFLSLPETFTGEDVRLQCQQIIGNPAHHNAWGALIRSLTKRGLIQPTRTFRHMRDSRSHARITPVYRRK